MSQLLSYQNVHKGFTLRNTNRLLESYLTLLSLSAIWGSSFLFIKLSIDSIPPSLLTFYRLFIASIFLLFVCNIKRIVRIHKNQFFGFFCIAIFGNVLPFNIISYSEKYVDSIIAATLIGTMPLFTFLIAIFMTKKKTLDFYSFIGVSVGFMGMIIFLNPFELDLKSQSLQASMLIVLSAFFYGLSANFVKKIYGFSALEIATLSTVLATIISLPFLIFNFYYYEHPIYETLKGIKLSSFLAATILGFLCTGIAILMFFNLIKLRTAVFASQSNFLIPCFGSVWSYMFLSETLSVFMFYGLIFIVFGGWLVNRSLKDWE